MRLWFVNTESSLFKEEAPFRYSATIIIMLLLFLTCAFNNLCALDFTIVFMTCQTTARFCINQYVEQCVTRELCG